MALAVRSLSLRTCSVGRQRSVHTRRVTARAQLEALVLDCDGVIVESEDLHRVAYNRCFEEFQVSTDGGDSLVEWDPEFYDEFQNKVGGGKPKMRWYFNKHGWPVSTASSTPPDTHEEREALVDVLQEWKTKAYQALIASGDVEPRPGILRLMQEARDKSHHPLAPKHHSLFCRGLKVAVCSAATKESVIFVLENLLGKDIFDTLDCFLAGDDVSEKKPSPLIYQIASERLQVAPSECVVIEDSAIGLEAALGAGMRCLITYTSSSKSQSFKGAELVVPNLNEPTPIRIEQLLSVAERV